MMRKLGIAVLMFALGTVAAFAADFNGKWTADVTTPRGTQTLTFDFHVDGSTLTGKITTPRGESDISNGKIDGDKITFDQVMNMNGNSMTMTYKGTAADGKIKFTREMGNGNMPPTEFVAQKAQ
jgi:hypothetical protein